MAQPRSPQLILEFPHRSECHFDNFIVSEGSRFAFNMVREFCTEEGLPSHTLYLSGGPGLGKTHLLLATGNYLAETRSERSALYLHCGDFVATVLENGASPAPSILDRLTTVDFLLMDDMDRIIGQKPAQERLYEIYNSLMAQDRKMIFAGRTAPQRMPDTESYLRSRFKWGLTAELQPMDDRAASRLARKLAKDAGVDIPDKIIAFLATRIPRDYPSIQHAVVRINQESLTQKRRVTLPLVKTALGLS